MEIELEIDYEKYKFIKENQMTVINYPCTLKINGKRYNCNYNNDSVNSYKKNSRIELLERIDNQDIVKNYLQPYLPKIEVKIGEEYVKCYISCTITSNPLDGIYIEDLNLIEL